MGKRNEINKINDNPGPGTYEYFSEFSVFENNQILKKLNRRKFQDLTNKLDKSLRLSNKRYKI